MSLRAGDRIPSIRGGGIRRPQSLAPGSTPIVCQMGGPPARGGGRGFGGPHLCGRDPEGLGDLGVELTDVGEALDFARGAAVRQLRAEDQARTGAGRGWGLRGRRRGRGRAWGLGAPGLLGRCALHGGRSWATPATATAVAAGSAASCSLPSPRPRARQPSRWGKGIRESEPPWKATPQAAEGAPAPGVRALPGPAARSRGTPGSPPGPEVQTGAGGEGKQGSPMRTKTAERGERSLSARHAHLILATTLEGDRTGTLG